MINKSKDIFSNCKYRRNTTLRQQSKISEKEYYIDKVIHINRCAKVVKGGRRFSFSALIVSGNGKGIVGVGMGKAKEVPEAIRKGTEKARKNAKAFNLVKKTIPHQVFGKFKGGKVLLIPASPGTGIVAGGGVRAILEAVGVNDILSKSLGSNNRMSVIDATLNALSQLRTVDQINSIRGKKN